MKPVIKTLLLLAPALALCGCLEVEQNPPWRDGQYDGKPDNLPQQLRFSGDRLAWNAAIDNRNRHQSEYARMRP
jgi:hypothetical protein